MRETYCICIIAHKNSLEFTLRRFAVAFHDGCCKDSSIQGLLYYVRCTHRPHCGFPAFFPISSASPTFQFFQFCSCLPRCAHYIVLLHLVFVSLLNSTLVAYCISSFSSFHKGRPCRTQFSPALPFSRTRPLTQIKLKKAIKKKNDLEWEIKSLQKIIKVLCRA